MAWTFDPGTGANGMRVYLSEEGAKDVSDIRIGAKVNLFCGVSKSVSGNPLVHNCIFLEQQLSQLNPSLEQQVRDYISGDALLPINIGQKILGTYILGSELPTNSSCIAYHDGCPTFLTLKFLNLDEKIKELVKLIKTKSSCTPAEAKAGTCEK